ncbi:unnamed protein product [Boreogadus saida]
MTREYKQTLSSYRPLNRKTPPCDPPPSTSILETRAGRLTRLAEASPDGAAAGLSGRAGIAMVAPWRAQNRVRRWGRPRLLQAAACGGGLPQTVACGGVCAASPVFRWAPPCSPGTACSSPSSSSSSQQQQQEQDSPGPERKDPRLLHATCTASRLDAGKAAPKHGVALSKGAVYARIRALCKDTATRSHTSSSPT